MRIVSLIRRPIKIVICKETRSFGKAARSVQNSLDLKRLLKSVFKKIISMGILFYSTITQPSVGLSPLRTFAFQKIV